MKTVSPGAVNRAMPQPEFSATLRRRREKAAGLRQSMPAVVRGLLKAIGRRCAWVMSVFCDWFAPGLFAAWKPQGRLEENLIGRARAESAAHLRRVTFSRLPWKTPWVRHRH